MKDILIKLYDRKKQLIKDEKKDWGIQQATKLKRQGLEEAIQIIEDNFATDTIEKIESLEERKLQKNQKKQMMS